MSCVCLGVWCVCVCVCIVIVCVLCVCVCVCVCKCSWRSECSPNFIVGLKILIPLLFITLQFFVFMCAVFSYSSSSALCARR